MIEKIKDIRNAIDAEYYLVGLALTLTLPDICGKIEYPEINRNKKSYITWFDKFVYPYYEYKGEYSADYEYVKFDGLACYELRCAYLHAGNLDFNDQNKSVKINQFDLCLTSNKDEGIYVDNIGVTSNNWSDEKKYKVRLDIRRLCKTMCDAAEMYYENHHNKEAFQDYTVNIINIEDKMEKIKS